jgi:hypothetical protein
MGIVRVVPSCVMVIGVGLPVWEEVHTIHSCGFAIGCLCIPFGGVATTGYVS